MKRRHEFRIRRETNIGDGTTRGRPKQRWMDCANRCRRAIGKTADEVHDRTGWRRMCLQQGPHSSGITQLSKEEADVECDTTSGSDLDGGQHEVDRSYGRILEGYNLTISYKKLITETSIQQTLLRLRGKIPPLENARTLCGESRKEATSPMPFL